MNNKLPFLVLDEFGLMYNDRRSILWESENVKILYDVASKKFDELYNDKLLWGKPKDEKDIYIDTYRM